MTDPVCMYTRVELIFKKFIIFFHEQTLVTIYRYKSKIVKIFGFQHLLVHAVLTIFGVKEPIANIDPKFSNLSCRSLHILIIYPYKFICLRLENVSIVKSYALVFIWGVKSTILSFTPWVMTSGRFLTNHIHSNDLKSCV